MFRIMLYNIYKGGKGKVDKILNVVQNYNPDFFGILEACAWAENKKLLNEFSKRGEFCFSHCAKANTKYDIAFFSKTECKSIENFQEGFFHIVVKAIFDFPKIGEVAIVVLHLSPKMEEDRFKELERIFNIINTDKNAILMGDFNSLSPHDPYNRELLLKILQENHLEKFGITSLRFDCIKFIEERGFVDVMYYLRKPFISTVPTPSNKDKAHIADFRLDYIFLSQTLLPCLKDAQVIRDESTYEASDHFPLIADFLW